jgi:hypothetical protein
MANLYELTTEFKALYASLDDPETDDAFVEQVLAETAKMITAKADNIGKLVRIWEAEEKAFEEEYKRLREKRDVARHRIDRIKFYLQTQMESMGTNKIEGELFKFAIQKNSRPSIEAPDPDRLPPEYFIITKRVDGDLLYQDWKAGKPLPVGVQVVQGTHLRIR